MISFASKTNILTILAFCTAIVACTDNKADDYCRDHHIYHEEHRAETGTLDVQVNEDGQLTAELMQPSLVFESGDGRLATFIGALETADNVYSAGATGQCSHTSASVTERDGTIFASYKSQCNTDDTLKKVDVSIFDLADEIDEIVVTVVTPATSKHFAISRQCSAAIFRLEKQ